MLSSTRHRIFRSKRHLSYCAAAILSGAVAADPALAAKKKSEPDRIEILEQQIHILQQQVQDLKSSQASKYAEVKKATDDQAKVVSFENGRPTFKKGDFSASLRSIVQFDTAYYSGDHATWVGPAGTKQDLSSGTNFRRARIGLDGQLGKGWDYSFLYDFGGSGIEGTAISSAYIQYSGLKPFTFRVGAFPPNASLEDAAGAADGLFLERASAVEVQRGLAGGDGRSAFQIAASGDRYLASFAYTGGKAGQTQSSGQGYFDEQQAFLGRLAGVLYSTETTKVVLGANGTYIFKLADITAGTPNGPKGAFGFSNAPEIRVDDTNSATTATSSSLVNASVANPTRVSQWGVDAGAQWKSLYAEGGYYKFHAARSGAATDPEFSGYYAAASWILTGESRRYNTGTASFRAPKVNKPFTAGPDTGWGAWEAAVRYSVLDLNFDEHLTSGIAGGEQDIWTIGLNWYPNNALRFSLNYLLIDVDRQATASPTAPVFNQKVQALGLRSQVAF